MPGFAGFVPLGNTIDIAVMSKNSSLVPTDADAFPSYRIYSPAGVLSTGSLTFKDSNSITGATNANPTVITSVGHGLITGTNITIAGVGGNTGANGVFTITKLDSNTFSIPVDTSAGSAYTSGGTWHVTGLYDFNFTPTVGANYASGTIYSVYVFANYSATTKVVDLFQFQVT